MCCCFVTLQTYWLSELLGGIVAGVTYDLVFATNATFEKTKSLLSEKDYDDSNFDQQGCRASNGLNGDQQVKDDSSVPQDYGSLH